MTTIFEKIEDILPYDMDMVDIDEEWNVGNEPEFKIHTIHTYPAKFPAFIAEKAIKYAKEKNVEVSCISDIFCGCGTVAFEAKRQNINFWGCDINPVATLIARVKSEEYKISTLNNDYFIICKAYKSIKIDESEYWKANERLRYWFDQAHYNDLKRLLLSINMLPNNKYRRAFQCLFSSILKSSSRWLTKSIKPQIDPNKIPVDVFSTFEMQYKKFIRILEKEGIHTKSKVEIVTGNFLTKKNLPKVDLIITSPPYVTSYEYADLHQLSSLWLGFTDDYKILRRGTIGSVYNCGDYYFEIMDLNSTGRKIIEQLRSCKKIENSKIKSVARYFIDMQHAANRCFEMLNFGGLALFVVGDTEYKGIKICNSKHLIEALLSSGFSSVCVSKRKISKKILTPYRDEFGKFTTDKNKRKIYHEEFVIIGEKGKEVHYD